MKILLMGDSWGQGEYRNATPIPYTGPERYLKELGHRVNNVSAGSACNFGQLRNTYWTLRENSDYDCIVWFHTEGVRDIQQIIMRDPVDAPQQYPEFTMHYNLAKSLHYINEQNYAYAQRCFNEFNIPFIVIGGQGPVDPIINRYSFAQHIIPSWMQQLLGADFVAPVSCFNNWPQVEDVIEHFDLDYRQFVIENMEDLDLIEQTYQLVDQSALFPDNIHPSRECFKQLAQTISGWI
jgi:hypothetical protein